MDLPLQRRSDVAAHSIAQAARGAYSLNTSVPRHVFAAVVHVGYLSGKRNGFPVRWSYLAELQIQAGCFVAQSVAHAGDRFHSSRQNAPGF